MTVHTYRYKKEGETQVDLQSEVPGSPTVNGFAPSIFLDITVDSSYLNDLTSAMETRGYSYFATDPVTTPAQEAQAENVTNARSISVFIDGPAEGWPTGIHRTITWGTVAPSSVQWFTDNTLTTKIQDSTYTRNGQNCATTVVHRMFDTDGTTVLLTVTDVINYTGIREDSRTRSIA